jgi:hypothetical protein
VHQLHGISIRQSRFGQPGTPDDLPVELDHYGASVKTEVSKEIGRGGRAGEAARLAVNDDLKLAHWLSSHGASMARVAAAGSGECHSALMAATP